MSVFLGVVALLLILLILMDGFEAMLLPRRVTRRYRLSRLYYRGLWHTWRTLSHRITARRLRETFLSYFGPLSIISLFVLWVVVLIFGFGLLHWSLGTPLQPDAESGDLTTYLYMSGETFFTLGYGDVVARKGLGRFLTVAEAGCGFGFMAVIIGYLPVLYGAFSRREIAISLLDARAGSPPSASQLLLRLAQSENCSAVEPMLAEWERWCAELLESHVSFPVLSGYRSQHDNQSWIGALTVILDTCALVLATLKSQATYQAQLTFAMARHAAVDIALVFNTPPRPPEPDRLPPERLAQLRGVLRAAGLEVRDGPAADDKLAELRGTYEGFVNALAGFFEFPLPAVLPEKETVDNWQTSAWMRRTASLAGLPIPQRRGDDHFD